MAASAIRYRPSRSGASVCSEAMADSVWVRWSKTMTRSVSMNAAVGTATGSRSGNGTVGSKADTASYARAPTAPPVKRGIPSIGRTRRRDTNSRMAASGSLTSAVSIGRSGRVGRHGHRARLGPGETIANLEQPSRADTEERVAADPFAALDGFEEIRGTAIVEAQERADGRLQVGRTRGAQQDRVGIAGQTLRLGQAERIRRRHRVGL